MRTGKQRHYKGWKCGPVGELGECVEPEDTRQGPIASESTSLPTTWVQVRSPPAAPQPSSRLTLLPPNEQKQGELKVVLGAGTSLAAFCKANSLDNGGMFKVPLTELARAMRQF